MNMSQFTTGNVPGVEAAVTAETTQIGWSGRHGQDQIVTQRAIIHEDTVDAGNTPDTTLRAGVVLAYRDTDGKLAIYTPGASDGTQIAVGVLEQAQDMDQNLLRNKAVRIRRCRTRCEFRDH